MKWFCAQRGCQFEADEKPERCPVCNNPFIHVPGAVDDEPVAEVVDDTPVPDAVDDTPVLDAVDDASMPGVPGLPLYAWDDLTVPELRSYAAEMGLKGYSRLRKSELIALIVAVAQDAA